MDQQIDPRASAAVTEPVIRSTAAVRMRAHRERRRLGLRCLTIQLFDAEVDVLVGRGFLKIDARNDPQAVCEALHAFFDSNLGPNRDAKRGEAVNRFPK
jgi:hypothetical protein